VRLEGAGEDSGGGGLEVLGCLPLAAPALGLGCVVRPTPPPRAHHAVRGEQVGRRVTLPNVADLPLRLSTPGGLPAGLRLPRAPVRQKRRARQWERARTLIWVAASVGSLWVVYGLWICDSASLGTTGFTLELVAEFGFTDEAAAAEAAAAAAAGAGSTLFLGAAGWLGGRLALDAAAARVLGLGFFMPGLAAAVAGEEFVEAGGLEAGLEATRGVDVVVGLTAATGWEEGLGAGLNSGISPQPRRGCVAVGPVVPLLKSLRASAGFALAAAAAAAFFAFAAIAFRLPASAFAASCNESRHRSLRGQIRSERARSLCQELSLLRLLLLQRSTHQG
jgi:hypothetical protein